MMLKVLHSRLYNVLQRSWYGALFVGAILLALTFLTDLQLFLFFLLLVGWILCIEWPPLASRAHIWWLTPCYPILPSILLLYFTGYRYVLLYILTISWVFDTAAYIIGSCFGYTKIAPRVSPAKSLEGFLGGWLVLFACMYAQSYSVLGISYGRLLSISLTYALALFAGDLFESWLKRKAGLKDAGGLLPGHGGLLDRFDGVFFLAIYYWVCLCC